MSSSVDDISSYLTPSTGVTKINSDQAMTEDDFLKLLSTELQNQDPTNPLDNKELILQLAQFSTLSATSTLNSNMENFISTSTINTLTGLMGKSITYTTTDSSGNSTTSSGTVDAVNIGTDGTVKLDVGGNAVSTSSITSIKDSSTTTTTTSN